MVGGQFRSASFICVLPLVEYTHTEGREMFTQGVEDTKERQAVVDKAGLITWVKNIAIQRVHLDG